MGVIPRECPKTDKMLVALDENAWQLHNCLCLFKHADYSHTATLAQPKANQFNSHKLIYTLITLISLALSKQTNNSSNSDL